MYVHSCVSMFVRKQENDGNILTTGNLSEGCTGVYYTILTMVLGEIPKNKV